MKISGFTMVKNADKLYYPIREAIASILPVVDEMIVALGDNDPDDKTIEKIESLRSDKVRIIHTVWDTGKYPNGTENAHQTDLAKEQCRGEWLFYIQADEVVHEKFLPVIEGRCRQLLSDRRVDGLLFKFRHFWGDYRHSILSHGWYREEIRIIRNDSSIHSWGDAQSFRRIHHFDGTNYRMKNGTAKLNVARVAAEIYHYGWVRPPEKMQQKRKSMFTIRNTAEIADQAFAGQANRFHYGPLKRINTFQDTHPEVMKDWISHFNWSDQLDYASNKYPSRKKYKHEKLKYKVLTWIENNLNEGNEIAGTKNYKLVQI